MIWKEGTSLCKLTPPVVQPGEGRLKMSRHLVGSCTIKECFVRQCAIRWNRSGLSCRSNQWRRCRNKPTVIATTPKRNIASSNIKENDFGLLTCSLGFWIGSDSVFDESIAHMAFTFCWSIFKNSGSRLFDFVLRWGSWQIDRRYRRQQDKGWANHATAIKF